MKKNLVILPLLLTIGLFSYGGKTNSGGDSPTTNLTTTQKRNFSLVTDKTDSKYEEVIKNIEAYKSTNKVYAVSSLKGSVKKHFPDLNLDELAKLYPPNSNGIRIYYGLKNNQGFNYLVFTKKNPKSNTPNDIINKIYIVDGVFKVYPLSIEVHPAIMSNHFNCKPDCPDTSIMRAM